MEKQAIRARQRARKLAVQALYQWMIAKQPITEIEAQVRIMKNMDKIDDAYFSKLLHGISTHLEEVETAFMPYLDREINELSPVELSILRLGSYELLFCPETPYRIILDESVNLAKTFGSQEGYRYVNGVLNKLAKSIRQHES